MTETRRFEFHISKELDAQFNAWRGGQPDLPGRSEAARLLIHRGIQADNAVAAIAPDATVADHTAPASTATPWRDAPWNAATVREDGDVPCNARIRERTHLQLEWLRTETGRAKREIVDEALTQYLKEQIEKRGIKM